MGEYPHQLKASKPTIGRGVPPSSFGAEGDFSFRIVENEIKLFIKARGVWHGVKIGKSFDKLEKQIKQLKKDLSEINKLKNLDSLTVRNTLSSAFLKLKDIEATGSTPEDGYAGLYINSNKLYFVNDSGSSTLVGGLGLNDLSDVTYSSGDGDLTITGLDEIIAAGNLTLDVAGDIELNADGGDVAIKDSTASANKPLVTIVNEHSGITAGVLKFQKVKGAAGAANDECGTITFEGTDANEDQVEFASIFSKIKVATEGQEGGSLTLAVASHDGEMVRGLHITDGDAEDEVDVAIGYGPASLTTINGQALLTKTAYFAAQPATGDGTTTIDWTLGNKFHFAFGAQNETITFGTNPDGPCNLLLLLKQYATGSRTVNWEVTSGTIYWANGGTEDSSEPLLTTTATNTDIISFYFDGFNYFGVASLNFET